MLPYACFPFIVEQEEEEQQEALASGRITIARPGGILYRMLIHQVYPLSLTTLGFQQERLPLKLNFYLYLRLDLK